MVVDGRSLVSNRHPGLRKSRIQNTISLCRIRRGAGRAGWALLYPLRLIDRFEVLP